MSSLRTIKQIKLIQSKYASRKKTMIEAEYRTINYYIKTFLHLRFAGRQYNKDYPRLSKKYSDWKFRLGGIRPVMVLFGLLRSEMIKKSKALKRGSQVILKAVFPYYGRFLLKRKFDFISPKTNSELRALQRYYVRQIKTIERNIK